MNSQNPVTHVPPPTLLPSTDWDSRRWIRVAMLAAFIAHPSRVLAATEPLDAPMKLSGVAWAKATYAPEDSTMRIPAIDLYRLQLRGASTLHEGWEALITLNASTASANLSSYGTTGNLYLHHVVLRKHFGRGLSATVGRMPDAFLGPIYRSHGTRFLGRQLTHAAGYLSSTPIGLSVNKRWGMVDLGATLHQATNTTGKRTLHLLGATFHTAIDFSPQWSLRMLHDYRHRNPDLVQPDPSESVVAATLTHESEALCISVEGAGRTKFDDLETIELGYGLFGTIDLYSGISIFGRIASGNNAFRAALNADYSWSIGPLLDLGDAVLASVVLDVMQREATELTVSLAAAKTF